MKVPFQAAASTSFAAFLIKHAPQGTGNFCRVNREYREPNRDLVGIDQRSSVSVQASIDCTLVKCMACSRLPAQPRSSSQQYPPHDCGGRSSRFVTTAIRPPLAMPQQLVWARVDGQPRGRRQYRPILGGTTDQAPLQPLDEPPKLLI
jgi:hypothetical protein